MADHLTKNTEYDEQRKWCSHCKAYTMHRRRPGEQRRECRNADHIADLANAEQFRADERRRREAQGELFT